MLRRDYILNILNAQININGHIVGVSSGSGMAAKYAVMGGADFVLALSAGKYRDMGRSSHASYLCYGNNNEIVMEMGTRELLPAIREKPVLFGLLAGDPFISIYDYLKEIRDKGFAGVTNFPTLGLVDGAFREALEEEGNTYDKEVEAIKLAHYLELFTVAFVTDAEQTEQMLEAGADVICVHLGLTKGGVLGAKRNLSLEEARRLTGCIFAMCDERRPKVIKMIYAGPANTPIDMQYLYKNTSCQGYIGGSTFDRIPIEKAVFNTTKAFKSYGSLAEDDPKIKAIEGQLDSRDYVRFVKEHIEEHWAEEIQLGDLALFAHISAPYLSTKFKKEVGLSFTEYLIRFRINKAKGLLREKRYSCREVADKTGYPDYAQFSKIFKKHVGVSPSEFIKAETE